MKTTKISCDLATGYRIDHRFTIVIYQLKSQASSLFLFLYEFYLYFWISQIIMKQTGVFEWKDRLRPNAILLKNVGLPVTFL